MERESKDRRQVLSFPQSLYSEKKARESSFREGIRFHFPLIELECAFGWMRATGEREALQNLTSKRRFVYGGLRMRAPRQRPDHDITGN
jgi:hypothetical protein